MAYSKDIDQEIEEVTSLKTLAEIYGEIAAIRMRKIRNYVLSNRVFLSSINSIFKDALATYAAKLSQMVATGKIKEGGKVTFLAHNGKTVAVLISANAGLFGEVVGETFKKFIQEARGKDVEISIIGRVGRSLFMEAEPKRPYTYFDLPDYGIDSAKISEVIRHLVEYEEIRIYYGEYISIITQKPKSLVISAGTPISGKKIEPRVKYIFEPTVEKILMFFETQIFASLFDQSSREAPLAKFASRILAMDRASENISRKLSSLASERLKNTHAVENKEQLNSLPSAVFAR